MERESVIVSDPEILGGTPCFRGTRVPVDSLSDRNERRALLVEHLHDPSEVEQGACQPIHFVHDYAVGEAGFDVGEKPLERRPVHVGAGVPAVVILLWQGGPAFVTLAVDEGLGSFALGVERVERLIEAFVGGFPRVDGAADVGAAHPNRP